MKPRKVPIRMCAGCQEHRPKRDMVRVVRSPEGDISLDLTGKKSGRGVYLCGDAQCLALARKAKRLERALSCAIPQEVFQRLEEELEKSEG